MNVGGVSGTVIDNKTKDVHPISPAVAARGRCRDWDPKPKSEGKVESNDESRPKPGEFDPENQSTNYIGNHRY